ncbi:MBL fold metallo-hydrolase [Sphingorhabdus buctiana]|uniref:MBL fold metallo-hydrolase n=1 Tax=Sphingorhabdus buctiana TaxID=1508805 RepID=A0ABW4MFE8_9SPHN
MASVAVLAAKGILFAAAILAGSSRAATTDAQPEIITLGTMAGPMPNPSRGQPATLLRWEGGMILVDAGDGAVEQMARAGIDPLPLKSVVISHIHADHVGGLFALLSRRYQLMDPPITVYGPPGTKALIAGLVAAMEPLKLTSPALPGVPVRIPADGVKVVEFGDGAELTVEGVTVRAVANTHYLSGDQAPDPALAQSLSLRFELPGRSIVLTGDTGPSGLVSELARGADVLVSSILDLDGAVATIRASRPNAPPAFFETARAHFAQHHLSPEAAGRLAQSAGVKKVVFTHIGITPNRMKAAKAELQKTWKGPVVFAHDLGRY